MGDEGKGSGEGKGGFKKEKPAPKPDPRLRSPFKAIETGAPVSVDHEAEDVGSASESSAEATEPAGNERSAE